VIDGGSRGAVGVATQVAGASCVDVRKQALTHESVKLTHKATTVVIYLITSPVYFGINLTLIHTVITLYCIALHYIIIIILPSTCSYKTWVCNKLEKAVLSAHKST